MTSVEITSSYKKRISSGFVPLERAQIETKISGSDICVTRKLDGEMEVIFFEGGKATMMNSGGTSRHGLPCLDDAESQLIKAGLGSAVIVAELHVDESGGRKRIHDMFAAVAAEKKHATLRLAPFDIIELDGKPFAAASYSETHKKLSELFSSDLVKPVPMRKASSRKEVLGIFDEWVTVEGAEGIVVRSEMPIIYKVKPKHTIDAVIVGYTSGDGDNTAKVRDILLAVMHKDGRLQIIGKTGNGLSEEMKSALFAELSETHMESDYIETDSRNIAFHMVNPSIVVETGFTDLITENASGVKKTNMLLDHGENGYRAVSQTHGVSLLHPVLERIRDDKKVDYDNLRVTQVTDLCYIPDVVSAKAITSLSEVIRREVYKKGAGEKLMVQKFIAWKTNKQVADSRFPAYVFHYTDFSCGRKDMLKRDVRVSHSREQIDSIFDQFVQENAKKGWEKC